MTNGKLILLRHGQSKWNESNQFTGWVDVDLTEKGEAEAKRGGELLAQVAVASVAWLAVARPRLPLPPPRVKPCP